MKSVDALGDVHAVVIRLCIWVITQTYDLCYVEIMSYIIEIKQTLEQLIYSCHGYCPGMQYIGLFHFRADDFNDPIHLERISTLNTFTVSDLGAVRNDSLSTDYTSEFYRINEW